MDGSDERVRTDERESLESKLGLDSIKELAVDQFPQFLQEVPSMNKESVLAILASLPNFQNLVTGSLDNVEKGTNTVLSANWRSQKKVHSAFTDYRRMIDRELESGDLDVEDKWLFAVHGE